MDVTLQAKTSISEYQLQLNQSSANKTRVTQMCRNNDENWTPPPKDTLKLNVDAHFLSDGHWGLGWILRTELGSCVGAATRVVRGITTATEAEAQGLWEAIDWLDQASDPAVIIETDNQEVVNTIHNRRYPRSYWGGCAQRIGERLEATPRLSLRWIRRTGNQVACQLDRWAAIEPNRSWAEFVPHK
ncbi:hypothetical protein TSUD_116000 [Trifolium subterraneum]|uniref:RNase H type-1 domain-containing protein n=1 Tax=Trifolium subterraneum TaxID=3900 RepID=A0A2Z6LZW3_TRISU|nr:hypothetical protein TSUD_116000 [Trifolium subterraneum]